MVKDGPWPLMFTSRWRKPLKALMSDTTKWDKRAKALRYKWDKSSFHKARWEKLDRKEKDFWRGRVQQWEQDQAEHVRHSSSSS
jgi:hypothetical protein